MSLGAAAGLSALLALAAALGDAPRAGAEPASGPLPWRVGGRVGFTVDAAAFPDSVGYLVDVFVRIPPSTVEALADNKVGVSQLQLSAELRSAYGARRQEASQLISFAPADTNGGFGKVVVLHFPTRPGAQRLKVRVEDVLSRKAGLVGAMRSSHETAEVNGEFELPKPVKGLDVSDPEFVWESAPTEKGTPFTRAGQVIVPDPERLYGLFATDLRVAFTARSTDPARAWHWRVRVLDALRNQVAARDTTAGPGAWLEQTCAFDVAHVPAGGYDLELSVWQEGDAAPQVRMRRFSVAWRPESWQRGPAEMADLVHLLLEGEDEERFVTMSPGEQERWLEEFWRRRDPTPDTGENEARITFLKRVDVANERFSRAGLQRGMFSDMGRVYIRYGEPSETLKQVMPAGDETLLQELQDLAFTEDRDLGDIQQKGPGGDMRPYEVWIYEGDIPLPLEVDPHEARGDRRKKLVFLFVDERGLGDYRLRYSNE